MTDKTKRRLCAALAAGMMMGSAMPARAAENPSTDRKSCASCSVPLPLTREALERRGLIVLLTSTK